MRSSKIINLVKCSLFLIAFCSLCVRAQEISPSPQKPKKPIQVSIGVDLLYISALDLKKDTCTFDMYFIMHTPRPWHSGTFEIMNSSSFTKTILQDTPTFKVFRVVAETRQDYDFRNYPFMAQHLEMAIEDVIATADDLVYVVNPKATGIDQDFSLPGWYSKNPHHLWGAMVVLHYYPSLDETYSRYIFRIPISRNTTSGIVNDLLPALIFSCAGLSALFYKPKQMGDKIAVLLSAILASVLHHQFVRNELPGIGYLTYFDKFIITNYAMLLLALALITWQTAKHDAYGEEYALRFDKHLRVSVIGSWILIQAILLITMQKQSEEYSNLMRTSPIPKKRHYTDNRKTII